MSGTDPRAGLGPRHPEDPGDGPELSEADVRLNAEGDVLGIVTKYGGATVVAGPAMNEMVRELTDLVLAWRNGERL